MRSTLQRVVAQAGFETRVVLGNGEQLLLTFMLPLLALIAMTKVQWLPLPATGHPRVDVVVPGVLAVAVLSTAFTGQAIMTAFDRRHGVLRLFGTTPLGRGGLLAARIIAILLVESVQAVSIGALGLGLGWSPSWTGLPAALVVGVLGTAAFAALGLLLGGTMRAEGVLAVANLIWVLLAAAGGLLLPHRGAVADAVALLPSGALGDGLRSALLDGAPAWREMAVLAVWALIAAAATRRWFRWS